eukprot:gnl/MRDRNA2_/MRDRNA2_31993_c0_seq1.p1 gnl/MRDRNA2_/MRDRNA2_31993_c0~~gnl/MRDRNA2_/MRDRNA2_31993_c0_seq1.p1  ORF type:complete len:543 (+),score=139.28 gnl/MRDRNA2_/MRDRNA2_31993_c0_seq1:167-1630(+)
MSEGSDGNTSSAVDASAEVPVTGALSTDHSNRKLDIRMTPVIAHVNYANFSDSLAHKSTKGVVYPDDGSAATDSQIMQLDKSDDWGSNLDLHKVALENKKLIAEFHAMHLELQSHQEMMKNEAVQLRQAEKLAQEKEVEEMLVAESRQELKQEMLELALAEKRLQEDTSNYQKDIQMLKSESDTLKTILSEECLNSNAECEPELQTMLDSRMVFVESRLGKMESELDHWRLEEQQQKLKAENGQWNKAESISLLTLQQEVEATSRQLEEEQVKLRAEKTQHNEKQEFRNFERQEMEYLSSQLASEAAERRKQNEEILRLQAELDENKSDVLTARLRVEVLEEQQAKRLTAEGQQNDNVQSQESVSSTFGEPNENVQTTKISGRNSSPKSLSSPILQCRQRRRTGKGKILLKFNRLSKLRVEAAQTAEDLHQLKLSVNRATHAAADRMNKLEVSCHSVRTQFESLKDGLKSQRGYKFERSISQNLVEE